MSWLLFSFYCIGQIWPSLPYGLHAKIPMWVRAKPPVPYALEGWGLLKYRLGLVSVFSTRVMFASAALVDLLLPNPIIPVCLATTALAWPCCRVHDWQPHGNPVWNTWRQEWVRSCALATTGFGSSGWAAQNDSSGFWNGLLVMLSHFCACNRFSI